jgi:hypothetical protein
MLKQMEHGLPYMGLYLDLFYKSRESACIAHVCGMLAALLNGRPGACVYLWSICLPHSQFPEASRPRRSYRLRRSGVRLRRWWAPKAEAEVVGA